MENNKNKKNKLLKSEDDFIFTEGFDKVVESIGEEEYAKIKKELDEICSKLPIHECKDGVILLDRNNPDDVDWYNED
jgi:hypothetical protein